MNPRERADDSADCEPVVATEVDLSSLATVLADLEAPRIDHPASPGPELQLQDPDECTDLDESKAESPVRHKVGITVLPQSQANPQNEVPPPPGNTSVGPDDFSSSPKSTKGKLPQTVHYSKDFVIIDPGLTEAPHSASDTPDISSVHPEDDIPYPSSNSKGKQPQRIPYVGDFFDTEAGSSSMASAPPPPRNVGIEPVSTAGLAHGQPIPWELDPERPAQKLPIRLKDALGRTLLIPWKRAKTWEGMKMTIDSQFQGLDFMDNPPPNPVANGRYHLHVSLPSSVEPPKRKSSGKHNSGNNSNCNNNGLSIVNIGESNHNASGSNNNNNDTSNNQNGTNNNNSSNIPAAPSLPSNPIIPDPPSSHMRAMIILPEFWEDLIQPGSYVSMIMWPHRPPRAAFEVPIVPNIPPGMPPPANIGIANPPGIIMPPIAPPHPRFVRIRDPNRNSRPKTKARSGRPRRMRPTYQ